MRKFGLLAATTAILFANQTRAAETNDRQLRKFCDPVCELRSQDQAFSLLMETYRQFQCYQIESDYQTRLRQCAGLSEERGSLVIDSSSSGLRTLRQFVLGLAKAERDLRMQKLETECANFHSAYGCARRIDEDYIGETVPTAVDQRFAAQKLKDYCVVTPGALAKGDIRTAGCVPAGTVLLDAPTVQPDPKRLVESCE